MTPKELNKIEARCSAATPGPWKHYPGAYHGPNCGTAAQVFDGNGKSLVEIWDDRHETRNADVAFIAHSRTDEPALIAEVKRLQGLIEESKEAKTQILVASLKRLIKRSSITWQWRCLEPGVNVHAPNVHTLYLRVYNIDVFVWRRGFNNYVCLMQTGTHTEFQDADCTLPKAAWKCEKHLRKNKLVRACDTIKLPRAASRKVEKGPSC